MVGKREPRGFAGGSDVKKGRCGGDPRGSQSHWVNGDVISIFT